MRAPLLVAFVLLAVACSSREPPPSAAPPPPAKLHLEPAPPDGDVAPLVHARAEAVAQAGGHLLVYVGATWCEPCQEFHRAAASGALDQAFPGLVLLEFDADRDRNRLVAAGYDSELIPLFVRPGPDGTSSGRLTQGVRRGSNAVDDLTPRLRELLR